MNDIARKRAEIKGDNREWSPSDAIADAIHRMEGVEENKIHLFIVWREEQHDGSSKIRWNASNLQRHDQIALIELLKFDLCKEWFGYGE